jgi:PmbA protein
MNNRQILENTASFVLSEARRLGASDAEIQLSERDSTTAGVRLQEVEELHGSSSRTLVFQAYLGQNSAATRSSDFSRAGLKRLIRETIDLAKASQPDSCAGPLEAEYLGASDLELQLFDAQIGKLPLGEQIKLAKEAEHVALSSDPRVTNSDGAGFSSSAGVTVYGNSRGFLGSYAGSRCGLHASVIAGDSISGMQSGVWSSSSRKLSGLETAHSVGITAARRALQNLGARKVKSQRVPVIFDKDMAAGLLRQWASAASGLSVHKRTSFLADKLGQKVACSGIQIIDDGLIPGALGSRPFNSEGQASRYRSIVKDGVLESFFIDAYAARKLAVAPNGGGPTNLYIANGNRSFEEIIASVRNGLLVTAVSGPGFNVVSGDYSRGAAGLWIENGEIAYPVEEITVAGNLIEMFESIEAIGNDLALTDSVVSPTLKFAEMMVGGE